MSKSIATIGVYGYDADSFIETLRGAGVTLVVDVRQRRGVRGSQYAWANSKRLQELLQRAEIAYRHEPSLAPTTELRRSLQSDYASRGIGQRSRQELSPGYIKGYRAEILDRADLESLVEALPRDGLAALMCLETEPEACHRSLIAERLAERHGLRVSHLRPPSSSG